MMVRRTYRGDLLANSILTAGFAEIVGLLVRLQGSGEFCSDVHPPFGTLWLCQLCLQLFDRISSKVATPIRAPPSDGIQRARDAADALRDMEHRRDIDYRDLQELQDFLNKPHFKVNL